MKALSLKLREDVFKDVERIVKETRVSRNAYINDALVFYNKLNERRRLRKILHRESRAVSGVSMEVLREMEKMEDDLI